MWKLLVGASVIIALLRHIECKQEKPQSQHERRQMITTPENELYSDVYPQYSIPFKRVVDKPVIRTRGLQQSEKNHFQVQEQHKRQPANDSKLTKNEFEIEFEGGVTSSDVDEPSTQSRTVKPLHRVLPKTLRHNVAKAFVRNLKPLQDTTDVTGSKRIAPAAVGVLTKLAGNEKVQEAVVEKGIEVAGKLIDKQLENIASAQEKAAAFLRKEIKLNIIPDKGWNSEDLFVPAGYHINAKIEDATADNGVSDPTPPYTYTGGLGTVMMNGCWGTNYSKTDPCYNAIEVTTQCRNMIDGAAFIGVGFDGRGKYSPESRKMSIIQRSCAGHSSYDNLQVPDTMNVHGIYDTSATMQTFSARSEYQKYLQKQAGTSGSFFGFSAGVKSAWGNSESGSQQTYLAIFDIDVDRYEIFQDEVKPQDLSRSFLREFMDLPTSYFSPGAPHFFQEFILRWGTHYIKSARFGGQLELRKTQQASQTASKEEFAKEMEAEYKSLFWSAGVKSSEKSGSSSKSEQKFMSSSMVVQGGSQKIASVISDLYSPTFKNEFSAWLESIPDYPKAFKFLMSSITDLLNFRANDLFPDEPLKWGCEGHKEELKQDGKDKKSYYTQAVGDKETKVYCEATSREELEVNIKRRRTSLKRAIEVYMEEGPISISDVSLPAGDAGCQSKSPGYQSSIQKPAWDEITTNHKSVLVLFDMLEDLQGAVHGGIDIKKSMARTVYFSQDKWYTSNSDGEFHLYDGFSNGGTGIKANKKISIYGLVLTYKESDGSLELKSADYAESRKFFPELSEALKDKQLARAEWPTRDVFETGVKDSIGYLPCNVEWSNALRFDPSDRGGKCLHFTASTKSTVFVVFSVVPSNKDTWYYIEVSPVGVGIYKSQRLQVSTVNTNAVSLGDPLLYQSYFVCISESSKSTVIEYGKTQGTTDSGDVYLTMIDTKQPLNVRFYTFGNGEEPMQVMDAHVVSRSLTQTDCKGDTHKDIKQNVCTQKCHETCDPMAGCKRKQAGEPLASECNACRLAYDPTAEICLKACPRGKKPNKKKICVPSFQISFKSDTKLTDSNVQDVPMLTDFTICTWLRIRVTDSTANGRYYGLFQYKNRGATERAFYSLLTFTDGKAIMEFAVRTEARTFSIKRVPISLADKNWHLFCITREGSSGETTLFADGVNSNSYSHVISPGVVMLGGTLHFGGDYYNFPGDISDMNIWDKTLTEEEIQTMAQSCGDIGGNVKDWYDIKEGLTLNKFNFEAPSTCTVG